MPAFGSVTNLSGGTITLTLPINSLYWYIQNQDTSPLKVTFSDPSFGPAILNPCDIPGATTGWAGDWIDSRDFPFFGASVTLTSLGGSPSNAQFGSGSSLKYPTVIYSVSLASQKTPG
jgi:hypothetical protein